MPIYELIDQAAGLLAKTNTNPKLAGDPTIDTVNTGNNNAKE
ncbi:MAG: hypothetical protein PHY77_07990 [Desulfotomaculaceae bacterium]|nr:hypothetical protein [Desulfotomaculaceae bacterium]